MRPAGRLACTTAAALLAGFAAAARAGDGAEGAGAAEGASLAALAPAVEREIQAGRIPGAVVLVGRDGEVVYRRAFGERAREPHREPMTADTVFDLASLTKVVATTTAILQLAERGALALDDPVARHWPEFARHGKGAITVRDLLAHRSGLRPDLDLDTGWSGEREALRRIADERPLAAPGARLVYSDINFEVLGELVRRLSGRTLDRYCAERVFGPLGMRDTGFAPGAGLRARTAPTQAARGTLRRGEVHDPTARRMGGVAGHAGLFSTADDLARFAQMLLDGGSLGGVRVLRPESVAAMTEPQPAAGAPAARGLGWELASPFVATGDAQRRAFGHTGFTGTSLWIDPGTRSSVSVLTNRVHVGGRGDARPLRAEVAAVVAEALAADRAAARVATGLDVLVEQGFAPLAGLRVGLITNHTGLDASGARTLDLLHAAHDVRLAAVFSPEHGLDGNVDAPVPSGRDARTGLPVYSLYGADRRPTDAMLEGLDALVFDVQDAGVRFYTYVTTLAYAMEAAARRGLRFFVLDRPNPIGADVVQGPVLDRDLRSFTGYFALPIRYGMTIGELAELFNAEARIGARLTVVPMRGYHREEWYDETGLRWVAPSPNLRTLVQAALYPGVAVVEGANLSVGRGTPTPFELLGAPWLDGDALALALARRAIGGVRFHPAEFTPASSAYAGRRCRGVRVELVDRAALDAPRLGLELASALYRLHPREFRIGSILGMLGSRATLEAIRRGEDPSRVAERWSGPLRAFLDLRQRYLRYGSRAAGVSEPRSRARGAG
jgi:uncharacterized protein YbbC (DUF1343 family)/CubicO group peptidase (beta-lactamase class C family)